MTRDELRIGDRLCAVYGMPSPEAVLLQPVDEHETAALEEEVRYIRQRTDRPFLLCAFPTADWNGDLSPWPAPAVHGGEPFRGGAAGTLACITEELLPALRDRYGLGRPADTVLGGYSLAGLFALWCGYGSTLFGAVAAASPSVWYDGWLAYAAGRAMGARAVYLSLGDREERARNQRLARVGDCLRAQKDLLDRAGTANTLVWEPGNHFRAPAERTARGFAWALEQLRNS